MIIVASAMAGIALACILYRRTMLGVLVGFQLFVLAATLVVVIAGVASGALLHGHVIGLFVVVTGVAQLVVGYALAVRLFYLKRNAGMEEVRSLKH